MLDKEEKDQIISKFKTHENDTGSSAIQIALLSVEVNKLTQHLQKHKKDHSSRRGLLRMVGQRRRLLKYLQKENPKVSEDVIKKLKIKAIKEKV